MIFKIAKRTNPFVMIDKRALNDSRLSWKAKGLHAYLLSKPHEWQVKLEDLIQRGTGGADSIRSAMNELRAAGYAKLITLRDALGHLQGTHWEIYERPVELGLSTEIGKTRDSENPRLGKSHTSNNEAGTKNVLSTKKLVPGTAELEFYRLASKLNDQMHLPRDNGR